MIAVTSRKSLFAPTALTGVIAALLAFTAIACAETYTGPIKEIPFAGFGRAVDKTSQADFCLFQTADECQDGKESADAGGFALSSGVAVAPNGDIYVSDMNNSRVQELTPTGEFVSVFGWEVDKTSKANICTAASGDVCGAGVEGSGGGQLRENVGITVDQTTGNVFVQDFLNKRVDEYTGTGEFVLTIGGEVDKTTKANVCTAASHDVCGAGVQGTGPGEFNFGEGGDTLAVGGAEDLLYVGDEYRVQEFDPATGAWKGEIPLAGISSEPFSNVAALTLDDSCTLHEPAPLTESTSPTCKEFDPGYGDIYLAYRTGGEITGVIHKFKPDGEEVKAGHFPLTLPSELAGAHMGVRALALAETGRLAVAEEEHFPGTSQGYRWFDSIYNASTGRFLSESSTTNPATGTPDAERGIAFGRNGDLYAATSGYRRYAEVREYKPVHIGELVAEPQECFSAAEVEPLAAAEVDTDVSLNCRLRGEVNPEEVPGTEAFFEWGRSPGLGTSTPTQAVCSSACDSTLHPVSALVEGVRPNESSFYYRVAGYDQNVAAPEAPLASEPLSFTTPVVPAWIGETHTEFANASSILLAGEVNPENAPTRYSYVYAPAKGCEEAEREREAAVQVQECPGATSSLVKEALAYGRIHTTLELSALQPATEYRYRMVSESNNTAKTETAAGRGAEASFTTTPAAAPTAQTGAPAEVALTSAVLAGSANPGGEPATYAFELGVHEGAGTRYGVLVSGPIPAATEPVGRTFAVSGLQPGTTYAYRIKVSAPGYGEAYGEPVLFTTPGLPSVLVVPSAPSLLAAPGAVLSSEATSTATTKHKSTTSAGKLANALEACRRKHNKHKRALCERRAHKKLGHR